MEEEMYLFVLGRYEKKLKEIMPAEQFEKFIEKTAKDAFRNSVENMADSDFKDFCREHFNKITK